MTTLKDLEKKDGKTSKRKVVGQDTEEKMKEIPEEKAIPQAETGTDDLYLSIQKEQAGDFEELFEKYEENTDNLLDKVTPEINVEKAKNGAIAEILSNAGEKPEVIINQSEGIKPIVGAINITEAFDFDDIVPELDETTAPEEKKQKEVSDPKTQVDEIKNRLLSLDVLDYDNPDRHPLADTFKTGVKATAKKNEKVVIFGNDSDIIKAIESAKLSKFKRINVPLINSGFNVEILGGGISELTAMYGVQIDEANIGAIMDHERAKINTLMKSIKGVKPNMPSANIPQYIHFKDANSLAYGYLATTTDTINQVFDCPHCGESMRVTIKNPADLILNLDELESEIENINRVTETTFKDISLMSYTKDVKFGDITVTIKHQNIAEYRETLAMVRRITDPENGISAETINDFMSYYQTLLFIDTITLGSGSKARGIWQLYQALSLFDGKELKNLQTIIREEATKIKALKFGLRNVKCSNPKCEKVTEVHELGDLESIAFFHLIAYNLLED